MSNITLCFAAVVDMDSSFTNAIPELTCTSCGHRAVAVDEESERLESGKAGAIAALAASAAGLPFALSSSALQPLELASSVIVVFITGLLFGVTYRYDCKAI